MWAAQHRKAPRKLQPNWLPASRQERTVRQALLKRQRASPSTSTTPKRAWNLTTSGKSLRLRQTKRSPVKRSKTAVCFRRAMSVGTSIARNARSRRGGCKRTAQESSRGHMHACLTLQGKWGPPTKKSGSTGISPPLSQNHRDEARSSALA